jgi:hypothetical protein
MSWRRISRWRLRRDPLCERIKSGTACACRRLRQRRGLLALGGKVYGNVLGGHEPFRDPKRQREHTHSFAQLWHLTRGCLFLLQPIVDGSTMMRLRSAGVVTLNSSWALASAACLLGAVTVPSNVALGPTARYTSQSVTFVDLSGVDFRTRTACYCRHGLRACAKRSQVWISAAASTCSRTAIPGSP